MVDPGKNIRFRARFGVYEILTAFYKDGREDDFTYVFEALTAGFAAGMVECIVSSPFEIIKLRAKVASASRIVHSPTIAEKVSPLLSRLLHRYSMDMTAMRNSVGLLSTLTIRHANILEALKGYPWMMTGSVRPPAVSSVKMPSNVLSLEGWPAPWGGLRSGLVPDSIFSGIFFLKLAIFTPSNAELEGCGNGSYTQV